MSLHVTQSTPVKNPIVFSLHSPSPLKPLPPTLNDIKERGKAIKKKTAIYRAGDWLYEKKKDKTAK